MTTSTLSATSALQRQAVFFEYPYTAAMLAVAGTVLLGAMLGDIDMFDVPGISAIGIKQNETGEIVLAFLLLIPAYLGDRAGARRRVRDAHLQAEQLRVVRSTMRTVQDVVNNNLNQLQLLRLEAEGCVAEASLRLFDQVIQDTMGQLTTIADIDVFVEKPMQVGPALKGPAWAAVDLDQAMERLDLIQQLADQLAKCSTPELNSQTLDLSSRLHQQVQAARRALNRSPLHDARSLHAR